MITLFAFSISPATLSCSLKKSSKVVAEVLAGNLPWLPVAKIKWVKSRTLPEDSVAFLAFKSTLETSPKMNEWPKVASKGIAVALAYSESGVKG